MEEEGYTTPKEEEYRIPEPKVCPPAPKRKPQHIRISDPLLERHFFQSPEIDEFFAAYEKSSASAKLSVVLKSEDVKKRL